jgi:hypothetical protein
MFHKFKKRQIDRRLVKNQAELEREYKNMLTQQIQAASSPMFEFFIDYFEAKLEINRDRLEIKDPIKDEGAIRDLQAEQRVMRRLVDDLIQSKNIAELELEETFNEAVQGF